MTRVYYSKMNKKNYVSLSLAIIGSILLLFKSIIPSLILLVIVVALLDGLYNKDIFIKDNEELYLLDSKNKIFSNIIGILLLVLSFIFLVMKLYVISLSIFYFIIIGMFLNNLIVESTVNKFLEKNKVSSIIKREIKGYNVYLIKEVNEMDDLYDFKVKDVYSKKSKHISYKLNKGFYEYNNLIKVINNI